jgi:hypothetical protein
MFKESGFGNSNQQPNMNGSIAERIVLGFQDDAGFNFLKNDPQFHEEVEKIVDAIIVSEYFKKKENVLGKVERTIEEKKELARAYVYERFLEISFIKNIEDKKIIVPGRDPDAEKGFDTEIKKVFSIRAAVNQVERIAKFNKSTNSDRYSENITTPFVVRLLSSLKDRLTKKIGDVHISYVPAIFENDALKTHLDGIRGTDAYLVVTTREGKRLFCLDSTGNPEKVNDQSILKRGMGIEKQFDHYLKPEDAKLRVYIEFEKVTDEVILAKMGNEMAAEIEKLYA